MFRGVRTGVFIASMILVGCTARGPDFTAAQLKDPDDALIYIYRPYQYFHRGNPDIPILYINDERLLRLKINGYTWVSVEPGTHEVLVRNSILGAPALTIGEVTVNAEPGKVYYLRFSQTPGDMATDGTVFIVTARSKLTPIDEATGAIEIRETKYLQPDQ